MPTTKDASQCSLVEFSELCDYASDRRKAGQKVVLCHGVFDLLHIGHIRHFAKAKEFGDALIVTVTPDEYVNKGPHRPAFHQSLRAEAVAALEMVDAVAINQWPDAVPTIEALKPDYYVKGSDYRDATQDRTGGIEREQAAVENVGGALAFTDEIVFSSSKLINQFMPSFPKAMQEYLQDFACRYSASQVGEWMDQAAKLRVLLIGETIIDEYHYCRTMGKSGKEPILAACFEEMERFAGGILAVGNHSANFAADTHLVSLIGREMEFRQFIEEKLNSKVQCSFIPMESGPTIVKKRFLESYPLQKLFELYVMEGDETCENNSARLIDQVEPLLSEVDLVIAVDYGHGLFSRELIDLLCEKAPFLALNTQINAGNQGYNTISKYPRADYICLSENEIRMDARQRVHSLDDIIRRAADRLGAGKVLVTRGLEGLTCFDRQQGLYEIPAFTGHAVDRVGAGDAVLSVTSLLAALNVPVEAIGLVGNAVGFQKIQHVGNRASIERIALTKFLQHALT